MPDLNKQFKVPPGWVASSLGDEDYFYFIPPGIEPYQGLKSYISTSSVIDGYIDHIEASLNYNEKPSRANMRPVLGSVWFAKMKDTKKVLCIENKDIEENYILSTGFSGVLPKHVHPNFLKQVFLSKSFNNEKDSRAKGSTMKAINNADARNIPILLPTPQEQLKIAELLESIDDAVKKTSEIRIASVAVKKALMQHLFKRGIGHAQFKKTEIGEIPNSWILTTLGGVVDFTNGKAHEGSIVKNGKYIVVNSKFISSNGEIAKHSNEQLTPLYAGDVAMVMSDIPNGRALAKCFLIDKDDAYTLNQRICSIRSKTVIGEYLYYCLNRNDYFLRFNDGVGQTNLRKGQVLGCPIVVPPINEQKQIVEILRAIDLKISTAENISKALAHLKEGLAQDLLTGKIRTEKYEHAG